MTSRPLTARELDAFAEHKRKGRESIAKIPGNLALARAQQIALDSWQYQITNRPVATDKQKTDHG